MYTHARKNPSEPSDTDNGVNRGTAEHEHARHRPTKPRRDHAVFRTRPNMACKRRRWRGPEFAAFFMRVACHQPWRSRKLPAVRLRPSVGRPIKSRHGKNAASGSRTYRAAGHDHTVYIRTRRSAFVPSAIDTGVNGFHASMTYPVRTIRNTQRRQRFPFEYDVFHPNHQKDTEASTMYI